MSSSGKCILLAEDNPALAGVVRFNLQRAGLDVTVAPNGRKAWELAQEGDFDMVVTDHQMPEMTGVELCQKLRQTEKYAETPILMLTAKGLELDIDRLRRELNVAGALPKPFSPIELVSTVEAHLRAAAEPSQP